MQQPRYPRRVPRRHDARKAPTMARVKEIAGRFFAIYYLIRSRGRIHGGPFILLRPSRLRLERGGRIVIGRGVVIEKGARIVVRARLEIDDDVYIGKNVTIAVFDNVHIGARTLVGENASIHSEDHGPVGRRLDYSVAPIDIGPDTWLGAGVVVTKGRSIGEGTTVGANAVVTSDLPAGVLAGGVPAKVIRRLV
jgi:acetyltransferase-like isoleucine patch superfamily enzyme